MITLTKNGSSIVFEFDGNSTYLNNGTIEVPVNSLALIIDQSDFATFRKSSSNDIFVSAKLSEFGMTKAELEEWYAENMVGETGGGGSSSGITSGEVQTMIDASVSGKADTTALTQFFNDAEYDSTAKTINFLNGNTVLATINATDFIKDGMVDSVEIKTISGESYLAITFNEDSGKEEIDIPISDIFDASNYYTKAEVDASLSSATADMATKTWVGNQGYITSVDLSNYATLGDVTASVSGKQDTLIAGSGISISANVISCTVSGGSGGNANIIEVTQAEYDALVEGGTVDPDAMYVITDATEVNMSGYAQTSAVTAEITAAVSGKADTTALSNYVPTSAVTTAVTSASTNNEIPSALAVYAATSGGSGGGGATYTAGTNIDITNDVINCTLPFSYEGDNLRTTVSGNSFVSYSHYSLVFGSNNTLQGNPSDSASNPARKIVNSNIIGLSNNLIRGRNSAIIGYSNTVGNQFGQNENIYVIGNTNKVAPSTSNDTANNNFIVGTDNTITEKTHNYIFGYGINPSNSNEFSIGKYNKSVNDGTTSGSTYFSIGNGTSSALTSNAFEIRQNGDIYITSGGTDILLQDHIGGGGGGITSGEVQTLINASISGIQADMAEDEEVTAAALNNLQENKADLSAVTASLSGKADTSAVTNSIVAVKTLSVSQQNQIQLNYKRTNDSEWQNAGTIFTVGSGLNMTVDGLGNRTISADKTSAVTSGSTAMVESGAVYAAMGGLKLMQISQADYDLLPTKDASTLYVITSSNS